MSCFPDASCPSSCSFCLGGRAKVGFYSDPAKGWIEGVAILCAVLVVAVVTATNDYSKDEQFRALNAVKDDVNVQVSRKNIKFLSSLAAAKGSDNGNGNGSGSVCFAEPGG